MYLNKSGDNVHRFDWQRGLLSLGLFVAVLLALPFAAYAQVSAVINGVVYDGSGAVIRGATLTLMNDATRDKRDTVTNDEGYFAFPALLTGSYSVKVSMEST
jgi:hypothetical protein